MSYKEAKEEIPSGILSSLEDLTAEVINLQELVLAVAASAQHLPEELPFESSEQIH